MRVFFLALISIFSVSLFGQKFSFINYSIESGLPQSQVSSFVQDNNGYLWIGTMGGLAKFNGQSFYTYTTKNSLVNNRISTLTLSNDTLFIGHEGGFSIGINDQFKSYRLNEKDKNVTVSKIIPFNGKTYIFTNGAGYYCLNAKNNLSHFEFKTLDQNRIRAAIVFKNRIYIATRDGVYSSNNGENFEILPNTKGLNVSSIISYNNHQLFYTTFDGEIGFYNLNYNRLSTIHLSIELYGLRNAFKDHKNQIWVPHLDGILQIDEFQKIIYINQETGLDYVNINTLYEDNNHTIWIGTEGKGIYKFAGDHIKRLDFQNDNKNELTLSILKDSETSYFGTYDGGLIIQNNKTKKNQHIAIKNNPIWALSKTKENDLLVGTENGLFKLNKSKSGLDPITIEDNEYNASKVTCIFTHLQTSFIGGSFGLLIYQDQKIKSFYPSSKYNLLTIRSIESVNNRIYIGSDNGLYEFKDNQFYLVLNFKTKINALKTDFKKRLWIGTEEGLFLLNNNQIINLSISNRPASNIINFINQDRQNMILGTNNGVYYSNLYTNEFLFKQVGLEEGLSNLETNINSSFIDNNILYFGTVSGVNILKLSQLEKNAILKSPSVLIKDVLINFNSIQNRQKEIQAKYDSKNNIKRLELPYNKNNILIELDGISLKNYQSLQYQYWVEGLEEKWSPPFNNPLINITNLPSGEYTIHIRGVVQQNLFSPIQSIKVTINPPFYLTTWFLLASITALVFVILFFIQLRIKSEKNKIIQEKLEIKNRLIQLEQQSLNASMNRHFIFNSLNSIQYYINTQDKYSANKYLSSFAKLIRKNLDSSIDKNLVTLDEELEGLKLYLDLEAMRFKDRFDYEIDDEEVITDNYQVPAMLLQPFVENSILHGILPDETKKGLITISINDYSNHIEIRIKDNGVGIEHSLKKKSRDQSAHRSKGMEISTKRINLLKQFYNSNFEIIGPYQTRDKNGKISGTVVLIKIPK